VPNPKPKALTPHNTPFFYSSFPLILAKPAKPCIIDVFNSAESEKILKVIQTFSSPDFCRFDVFNSNNVRIAYYYEYFRSPIDNELLDHVIFECYYDFDDVNDTSSSTSVDVFDDIENLRTTLEEILEQSYYIS